MVVLYFVVLCLSEKNIFISILKIFLFCWFLECLRIICDYLYNVFRVFRFRNLIYVYFGVFLLLILDSYKDF